MLLFCSYTTNIMTKSAHESLLDKLSLVSFKRRLLDMFILVFKSFQAATPTYISALLTPGTNIQGLRGKNMLQLPCVNTV